ncbi:MAG: cytochrome c maturation protein CcmE [Acidimicrobiales bacterium]|nr:cytochrome c maturation protein CcmE [Acidimicrobiales bacterium]
MDVTDDLELGAPSADESAPATTGLDLSPRPSRPVRSARSRPLWVGGIIAVLVVGGFLAIRALSSATVFFYTADEAVAKKAELGDRRFRIEGVVVRDSIERTPEGVRFDITSSGVVVPVVHAGDPPEMFQPGIPVVLEGHFAEPAVSDAFVSDRILVKHTEEYREKNPDRLRQAEMQGTAPDASSGVP